MAEKEQEHRHKMEAIESERQYELAKVEIENQRETERETVASDREATKFDRDVRLNVGGGMHKVAYGITIASVALAMTNHENVAISAMGGLAFIYASSAIASVFGIKKSSEVEASSDEATPAEPTSDSSDLAPRSS